MRIVHNPFVVLQTQQHHAISTNPFQEINSTISSNNNLSGIIGAINNTTGTIGVGTGIGIGTGTETTNLFQTNSQNLNNNPIDINSIVNTTSNLNGNTEDIVEKLSSIYGHIDDTINTIPIITETGIGIGTGTGIETETTISTNNIINSNNINLNSNDDSTNFTTNSNTFTNSFNQSYSNNIDNININNYFNNSNNINLNEYINNSCNSDNDEINNHNINNDDNIIINNNNKELDEKYKNSLVNDANNQKTILNNLNRLNNDNQQHQHQQQQNFGNNIGISNGCLNSNSNNINLRDNNNTNDLFLENLNVLCAKEDIKSPSSIEDFNIKTITGFNKLKSLQYYSDSSSQSSSDEEEIEDNDEDEDEDDDDTENDTGNEDQEYVNEKEIESDDNIENDEIDKYQNKNKNKFHKGQKSKENNENDADIDEEEDYNESSTSSLSSSSTTIQGIKKIRKNKNFNYGRDSIKLTNKITEFDLNEIKRKITTSPIEHTATFSRIIITNTNQQQIPVTKGSLEKNNIKITTKTSSLFYNKMAGDNEKNITNPEENEIYSEAESVEMKSLHDDNVASSNGSIIGDIEEMEIDKSSEFLDDNDIKIDNDIIENSTQNQDSDNISTKRRCSSPAGCVSTSDNTISEKSFPVEEKVTNTTLSTSSTSFVSANSSNGSTDYPRGIINPNYPGFQHLAHTLSEHFVNHPNDPDDSDLSEFEVELSIDDDIVAFNNDKIHDDKQLIIQNKTEDKKLNELFITKNNNSVSSKLNLSQNDEYHHNLMDVSNKCIKDIREHKEILLPEIRISFECHDLKLEDRFDLKDSPKRLAITTSQEKVPKVNKIEKNPKISKSNECNTDNMNNDNIIEDISCDLDTYLKKYETATDLKLKNQNKAQQQQQHEKKQMEKFQEILTTNKTEINETKLIDSDIEEGRNCPTPDILIKNCKNDFRRNKSSVTNRPDLLRNVSPQPPSDEFTNILQSTDEELLLTQLKSGNFKIDKLEKVIKSKSTKNILYDREPSTLGSELNKHEKNISRISIPNNIQIEDRRNDSKIEDNSFGTTPVDIVGDFGREVEREFGLLVSGYNSRILCRDSSPKRNIEGNQSPSPTRIENHEKKFIQKMADAHLSDAKENINFGSTSAPILNSSVGTTKSTSMIANIVVARATLNHPTSDLIMVSNTSNIANNKTNYHNNMPCDLLLQTNNNNSNKFVGVKTPSFDGDLKVTLQIPQKQQNQEQKIVEEKLLPSLLVSSTSNLEKPVKKIPPPPPPRRFLQQQLQQMQKRQQELQLQKQQKQKQQQNEQQQNQIDKQKYANNISQHNPFVSVASNTNQIELNETNQHIITTSITTTPTEKINTFEKLSKNNILSTSFSSSSTSLSTETAVPDTQQSSAINNTTTTIIIENNENNSDSCYVSDSGHIKLNSSILLTKTDDIITAATTTTTESLKQKTLTSVSLDKEIKEKQKEQEQQQFPTAIIKPKYQKFSYDDRQLPPVGIGVFEQNSRPWYEKNLNNNSAGGNSINGNSVNSGGSTNIENHRKIRKNNLNVNLSSYKSDQRYNTNDNSGTPNKLIIKNKHSRSSTLIINGDQQQQQQQQQEQQKYNCGSGGLQSIGEGHRSPSNRHSSSSRSHHHHHHHHHHHNRNHNSSNTGHHSNSKNILKENLSSIGGGCGGSGNTNNTTASINNGFVAIVTPRKKEKIITHDDEFIRHDIYKSLKKHNININNNNSYLLNNNNNNNNTTNINLKNDMNSRGSVIGYANINGIKSGGIGGNGGILIDNSYRTVIRNDSKPKYILNLNNKSNNNMSGGGGGGGGIDNCSSIDGNRIYKGGNNKNGKNSSSNSASFDVYNIETALPSIDMDAIETHLQKAKEEEKKRRNDREEIRRRLAMGAEDDYFSRIVNNTTSNDRPGRKPSLQSRLQNGNNLQICFMNDASSDTESISSDSETCPKLSSKSTSNASSRYSSMSSVATSNPYNSRPLSVNITNNNNNNITTTTYNNGNSRRTLSQRPSTLSLGPPISEENSESDFFTKQARLQIEARMALAQAKDMAHMQMEIERQKQKESPITEVIRNSMEKVGVNFPIEKRRVSRQMCTDMNIAQLQIIVNDLHTQIERLNDHLVQYLMERDELHMSQDSMLVDIEDLTRYLSAKEQTLLNEKSDRKNSTELEHHHQLSNNNSPNGTTKSNHGTPQMQSKFQRIASLVKK